MGFLEASRKAFWAQQGDEGQLSDWRAGFMPQLSMVEQNLLHQHVAQERQALREERLRGLGAEVFILLEREGSALGLEKLEADAIFSGLSKSEVMETTLKSLITKAHTHPLGHKMLEGYGTLHKEDSSVINALNKAAEAREQALYHRENRDLQRERLGREHLKREALSQVTGLLLDDPNYTPSAEETHQYVAAGFYDYPHFVEDVRVKLLSVPKRQDAAAKTRLYGRLQQGTLREADILEADFLSEGEKRQFLGKLAVQKEILAHPLVQSASQEILSHFASTGVGGFGLGASEEGYKAKRRFETLILKAKGDNPALTEDLLGFSDTITELNKKILTKGKMAKAKEGTEKELGT